MRPTTRALVLTGGGAIAGIAAGGAVAMAVGSGQIFARQVNLQNNVVINGCGEAQVDAPSPNASGYGVTWSHDSTPSGSCSNGYYTAPAGYLKTTSKIVRNGLVCNTAVTTNSGAAIGIGITALCSNPAGSQSWWSTHSASFYKGSNCTASDYCTVGYTAPYNIDSPTIYS